jgi:hypothetical protein
MADDKNNGDEGEPANEHKNGTANTRLTLEQALLAPLDSILKAQLHSARSFLNLLLQLGYPHEQSGKDDGTPYSLDFTFVKEGETQQLSVPALALVPISPLAVESANFQLEMSARRIVKQAQIRESVGGKSDKKEGENNYNRYQRPWFLVDKPVNIEGDIVASNTGSNRQQDSQSAIKININVKSIPMPAGLDKLISSLGNMAQVTPMAPNENSNNKDTDQETS